MFRSKKLVIVLVVVFSVLVALCLNNASAGNPFGKIIMKLNQILYLLTNEVIPRLDPIAVPKTGQTTVYATGDDGDWQMGRPWPEPRFTDNGDTVTDNMTGLMWTRDAQQVPGQMNWYGAVQACNALGFAEYNDWRLPNVRELLSLINYGRYDPALPDDHPFENVPSYPGVFWCSTTLDVNHAEAFHVGITNGTINHFNKEHDQRFVWAVRGGYQD